jgi:hypothetical protein
VQTQQPKTTMHTNKRLYKQEHTQYAAHSTLSYGPGMSDYTIMVRFAFSVLACSITIIIVSSSSSPSIVLLLLMVGGQVKKRGLMFLGGPPLVKMATGEVRFRSATGILAFLRVVFEIREYLSFNKLFSFGYGNICLLRVILFGYFRWLREYLSFPSCF